MHNSNRKYVYAADDVVEHDEFNTSIPKLPKASALKVPDIWGVLPFDGVRNPSSRSHFSQKVFFTVRTAANDWQPKVAMAESAAEAGATIEAELHASTYDIHLQPLTVPYRDEDGRNRHYTHDILVTFTSGYRRLIFVRNQNSLEKPATVRQIKAIALATPKNAADDMIILNASEYTRQRRDNLIRMRYFKYQDDCEADEVLLEIAQLRQFYYMQDLLVKAPIPADRAFAACYRLVARGLLRANLDNVLWEYSHLELVE